MKNKTPFVLIGLICATTIAQAQISCSSDVTHVSLSSLFTAVSIPASAEFTRDNKQCRYTYEGNAFDPLTYKFCSDWKAHKTLESIDNSILASFIRVHNKTASIGSGKLGLENRFTYTSLDVANGKLNGRERLGIKLFGSTLKLVPHNFSIDFDPPAPMGSTGGISTATWESRNINFEVVIPIPITIPGTTGTFELGLLANSRDRDNTVGSRSPIYSFINSFPGWDPGVRTDWLNYPAGGMTMSNYRNKFHLSNEYELTIYSPWIGVDAGFASAKMRLSLSANIKGELKFNESYQFDEPDLKKACPKLNVKYFQEHALAAKLSGNGKVIVRVQVPFKTFRKEFTIISSPTIEGTADFSYNGLNIEVPALADRCQLSPCQPGEPFTDPVYTSLTSPPENDPDEGTVDPTTWAQEVTQGVIDTYYICDAKKKEWSAARDKMVKTISDLLRANRISQAEAEKRLLTYLKGNVFLCERSCANICLVKEDVLYMETPEQTKKYLKEIKP